MIMEGSKNEYSLPISSAGVNYKTIEQQEIIDGEVIEIAEFGAFVRIGPMDGLVHVSQVTDDYIGYDAKRGASSIAVNTINDIIQKCGTIQI